MSSIIFAYKYFIYFLLDKCMVQQNENHYNRGMLPRIESKISKSNDGKWLIFQTIITEIKPVNYIKEIIMPSAKRGEGCQDVKEI